MNELPDRAQRLLAILRDDDMTPEERAHADAAVRSAFVAAGITDLPTPASASNPGSATVSGAVSAGRTGWRLALPLGLGAAGAVAAGLLALQPDAVPRAPLPPRPAPAAQAAAAGTNASAPTSLPQSPAPASGDGATPRASGDVRVGHDRSHAQTSAVGALEAELELIAQANGALQAERFADARRALREHERRFPHGALRIERDALRVLLLCSTGPSERARNERDRFLRDASHSLLAARVRAGCPDDHGQSP